MFDLAAALALPRPFWLALAQSIALLAMDQSMALLVMGCGACLAPLRRLRLSLSVVRLVALQVRGLFWLASAQCIAPLALDGAMALIAMGTSMPLPGMGVSALFALAHSMASSCFAMESVLQFFCRRLPV